MSIIYALIDTMFHKVTLLFELQRRQKFNEKQRINFAIWIQFIRV